MVFLQEAWKEEENNSESFSLEHFSSSRHSIDIKISTSYRSWSVELNQCIKKGKKERLEDRGIDPLASRMQSVRSTIWARPPGICFDLLPIFLVVKTKFFVYISNYLEFPKPSGIFLAWVWIHTNSIGCVIKVKNEDAKERKDLCTFIDEKLIMQTHRKIAVSIPFTH